MSILDHYNLIDDELNINELTTNIKKITALKKIFNQAAKGMKV
jgi:hypothetical protein